MSKHNETISEAHLDLMEKVLEHKTSIMEKYLMKVVGGPGNDVDEDVIYAFTKIADSVEDNIVKVSKLKLQREKNAIDSESNENMAGLLVAMFEDDAKRMSSHGPVTDEARTFVSSGEEVDEGVLITGVDTQTYDEFKERNKEE